MAIVRFPLKTDAEGKCTRWRVSIFNKARHRAEWFTIRGTKREAEAFERRQKDRVATHVYIPRSQKKSFDEVADAFLAERKARSKRAGTLYGYTNVLKLHLRPAFGPKEAGSISRNNVAEHFTQMRAKGASVQTVNRAIRTLKAVMRFALERGLIEANPMECFKPFEGGKDERHVQRGAFSEDEVRALLASAQDRDRLLIKLLVMTGLRPGEAFALHWEDVDLEAGCLHVRQSWDSRGKQFVEPKTKAGSRTVPLDGRLVEDLRAHRGTGLVFATRTGKPLSPSNVRRDLWVPLLKRAALPYRDMYSLRATFASLARASGEAAFNVSRMMGHSRSTLVDQVYARTLQSGLASVASAVAARVLGDAPKLRVIEGGVRDVASSLPEGLVEPRKESASV